MIRIGITLTFFLCVPGAHLVVRAQSQGGQSLVQTGRELLQQAKQLTEIRAGNAPSFRLTARVEVYDEKGGKKEGTYSLFWNSPTIWREQITFPDYSQTRLARIDKLLISRDPPSPSEQAYRVGKLLDFSSLLQLGTKDQILKLRRKPRMDPLRSG